jgi:hypothetical protein
VPPVRKTRSPKNEPFSAGPVNDAITADKRPLQDELLEMMQSGTLEEDEPDKPDTFKLKIAPLLDRLPPKEADMVEMYFLQGKREVDIGEIFGITQAGVAYRLRKAIGRIKWLLSVPPITETDVRTVLPRWGFSAQEVELLALMWLTTNVTEVSRRMGIRQGTGRDRFMTLVTRLRKLADLDPALIPYAAYFEGVKGSAGILWEGTAGRYPKVGRTADERRDRNEQILLLVRAGELSFQAIGKQFGKTGHYVSSIAAKAGIPPRRRGPRPGRL